ncbi:AAA family ATPase [Nonomuraea sp. NPDC049480]|uniref:nSTAND1 domain-containing NTPase n=1 Tax=Nonomuraea sp. NPDC049480 TaxID=3364353 RepID=UPI00378843B3
MGEGDGRGHRRPRAQVPTALRQPPRSRGVPLPSGHSDEVCPYQGLAPFETDKTEFYFGRARATHSLLERLGPRLDEHGSILLVSGASGVGKSSLLRAGLMPALAKGLLPVAGSQRWPRLLITPTSRPLRALAEKWTEVFGGRVETVQEQLRDDPRRMVPGPLSQDDRLVLVVDQFEELFLLVADEQERQEFVRALHALTEGPRGAGVIVGVRADYWDRCAAYPQFAEAIQDGQVIVEPMTESDLRLAITGPAAAVGLEIEPGLVEIILAELAADRGYVAGALPLLSQALLNTWERRENGRLTIRGYEDSGRVRDSVRRTADEVLGRLAPEDRKIAFRLFRRMTLITAGGRVARRRATLTEIHAAASADSAERRDRVQALLSAFAGHRLLTLHEDSVEIAHDALLTAWPALRQWLEPDLTAQGVYDRLVEDAAEWAENHRDPAFLYRGARLLAVQDSQGRWDRDPGSFPPPGPTVAGFVAASTRAARRAGRLRALVMSGLTVLAALALVAAGVAVNATDDAVQQRKLAVSRELSAESQVADNPVISALQAVTAWRIAPTSEARHRMLDLAANADRGVFRAHSEKVVELMFSPDGSMIVTADNDGVVRLWDTASRRQLGAPIVHPDQNCVVDFHAALSADGKVLATGCFMSVQFWDVPTRRPMGHPLDIGAQVWAMAFSPDGKTLAIGGYEAIVQLWDVAGRHQIGDTIGRPEHLSGRRSVNAVAFTPDGERLITAGSDDTARLWDTATQRQIGKAFTGHTNDIHDISLSPDGTTLATAAMDGTARLWSLATHEQIGGAMRVPGDAREFDDLAFSPDGTRIAAAKGDGYTRLWDVASRRPVGPALPDRRLFVEKVAYSPDGRLLATSDSSGNVWLWDPVAHRQVGTAMPAISDVAFSPDGKILAAPGPGSGRSDADSSAAARAARLWDVATQREVGRLLPPPSAPSSRVKHVYYAIRFSRDGRTLITEGSDVTVRLWDTATRRQLGSPAYVDEGDWNDVELSPDGRLLAVVERKSRELGVWDVASRREIGPRISVPGATNPWEVVTFSPDGAILAAGGRDRSVRFFDVAGRRQIGAPLPNAVDGNSFDKLEFSPDGKTLATTADDGSVRLWDVASRRQIGAALTGHTSLITAIVFSPDRKTLATGSTDSTVRVWDLETHRQIGPPLTGPTEDVQGVAYSPDGNTIAAVNGDGTVRLWNVALTADPVAATCANAGRSFTRAEWERYVEGEEYQEVCP